MPQDPQLSFEWPASTGLEGPVELTNAPTPPVSDPLDTSDLPVNIPVEDVTVRVDEINQVEQVYNTQLQDDVQKRVDAVLRSPNRTSPVETTQEYNERVKREFTEQVMEARRQAAAPPPPPQPVPPAIAEKTRREMAAGAKQSAYWAEQQKSRPTPNAHDIAVAGNTVTVFQPASYTHEKGDGFAGKDYTRSSLPGR